MKISAKINTMQNTNILLNELNECLLRYGPISDSTLLTLQLTSEESVSRHVFVQMVDILIFEHLLRTNFCRQFAFFMVQVASIHRVSFFTVLMLNGRLAYLA